MELSLPFLKELQNRLKVGNRLSTHLNAIPKKSNYKLDFSLLSVIDKDIPEKFLDTLLTKPKFSFEISWRDKEIDLFNLSSGEQKKITTISKIFTNLFNHVKVVKDERGVESFGFGFPLLIRKDRADDKITVAPLIIWKLEIARSKKNDSWIISKESDSAIYLNEVLINHLDADAGIIIDPLSFDMLDDGVLSKDELFTVCKEILRRTNISKISNADEKLSEIFAKVTPIITEDECQELALNSTNSIIHFSGLFSYFEIQKHSIIKDYDLLLELEGAKINQETPEDNFFQSFTSVQTDPSQQGFLNSIEKTRNLIIQGPPGTGKSQTLTALLINALENGKKTLVVCEKHTALDVLNKSLQKLRLSSHVALINDASANRQSIVSAVRNKLPNLTNLSLQNSNAPFRYSSQLRKIKEVINHINQQHQALDRPILAQYKWSDIVGRYLKNYRFNNNSKLAVRNNIKFEFTYDEYNDWRSLLQNGQQLYQKYIEGGENYLLNDQKFISTSFIRFEEDLKDALHDYQTRLNNLSKLKSNLYNQFVADRNRVILEQKDNIEKSINKLRSHTLNINSLIKNYKTQYILKEKTDFEQDYSRFKSYVDRLAELWNGNQNNPDFLNEDVQKSFLFKIGSLFSEQKKQTLTDVRSFHENFNSLFRSVSTSAYFDKLNVALDLQSNVNNFLALKKNYDNTIAEFPGKTETQFNSLDLYYLVSLSDSTSILEHIQLLQQRHFLSQNQKNVLDNLTANINNFFSERFLHWAEVDEKLKNSPDFTFVFSFDPSHLDVEVPLHRIEKRIATVIDSFKTKIEFEFLNADILRDKKLFSNLESYESLNVTLSSLSSKIKSEEYYKHFESPINLNAYIDYVQNLINLTNDVLNANSDVLLNAYKWINFQEKIDEKQKEIIANIKLEKNWEYAFLSFYFDRLLKNNAIDELPTDESLFKEYNNKVNYLEDTQIQNINDYWHKKQKESVDSFNRQSPTFQVTNLYNLRGSAGNRRYSLRNIIEYHCDLFTDMFPIILTTPDVASTLFRKKNQYFDFVVFDEASQLRLEDNLPAMLKGKQIVIAGDEHQMPPSSFFEKKLIAGDLDSEEDDDQDNYTLKDKSSVESALLSSISLLDAVSELNFENKNLNFHYRSRHPYLIDFSNYAFYSQKLVPLPVAIDYIPISYVNVGGIYGSNVNEKEADVVISILKNNVHKDSKGAYPSIGIATFNIKQRDLIKNKILEIKKLDRDKDFIKKIEKLETDGMFIKNLENIQGDERDVIIMSTTYGPDGNGRFFQRFGQLNNSKGYKLLNVIVTRAKYKNFIITSIPESYIGDYKSHLVTLGTNHGKAPLYAYLAYAKAVSDKNNDARVAVLQALSLNSPPSADSINAIEDKLESVFEEEVYYRLQETYLKDFVELQYKVGGFRIDMMVDFKIPGVPKIAIECDGAKYHSSNEAYLYDFHRQKILETHGFVFHRIWGTNWWRNPDFEMQKLLEFVDKIKFPKSGDLFETKMDLGIMISDEISIEDKQLSVLDEKLNPNDEIQELFTEEVSIVMEESSEKIKIGSIVKIKYIDHDAILQFKIVSPATVSNEKNPKIKEVYFSSPVGKAVLGKSEGDVTSIEGVDNIIEILEVIE